MSEAYDPNGAGSKVRRQLSRLVERRPVRVELQRPMVSFSFDDVPVSGAVGGAAVLESRGVRGTFYVSAGLAGRPGHMGPFAGVDEIRRLARSGHEIACHTYSHQDCGKLAGGHVLQEIDRNADAFAAWGLPAPLTFAYPYGEVAPKAKRAAARRFALARSVRPGLIRTGGDLAQAPAVGIEGANGEANALEWLGRAAAARAWLILYTHDVRPGASPWGTTAETLSRCLDEALASGFDVVTVAEGARRLGALR